MTNLEDLEAAMRTAKEMGQSKIHVHIFVIAELLAKCREAIAVSDFERDAVKFLRNKR